MIVEEAFDILQAECEKTAKLLKERKAGLLSWHQMVLERMLALRKAMENLGMDDKAAREMTERIPGW